MSALTPWALTWGKLLGSTAFNWYGGAFCLAVAAAAAVAGHSHPHWWSDMLTLAAAAVMLHAAVIALNLHTSRLETGLIQRGGLGWLAIVFALLTFLPVTESIGRHHVITWWGTTINTHHFVLFSAVVFAACATFAAYRVISHALQVRTIPWAWPLLALILAGYCAGLSPASGSAPTFALDYIGLVVAAIMTYATLLTEPLDLPAWNRLRLRLKHRDWRGLLEQLPLWPTTLAVAFCFALLATLADMQGLQYPAPFSYLERQPVEQLLPFTFFVHEPLTLALMLLRDAGIVMFFSFGPKVRRPATLAVLLLLVIDVLLPYFCNAADLEVVAYLLLPSSDAHGALASIAVMTTHAAIALVLVDWRLRRRAMPAQGERA